MVIMSRAKIAISLDQEALKQMDRLEPAVEQVAAEEFFRGSFS
jgi:hypothetical protein